MSEFADRLEQRQERYRKYGNNARARGDAARQREEQIGRHIPMGQPILVGHHSERRHRRDIDSIIRQANKQAEERDKAAYWDRKEAHVQKIIDGTIIMSNDPDAVEKLREKLTGLEAKRDRRKAINAAIRSGKADRIAAMAITPAEQGKLDSMRHAFPGYYANGRPVTFDLTNLGAEIRRVKERITHLERQARHVAAEAAE